MKELKLLFFSLILLVILPFILGLITFFSLTLFAIFVFWVMDVNKFIKIITYPLAFLYNLYFIFENEIHKLIYVFIEYYYFKITYLILNGYDG